MVRQNYNHPSVIVWAYMNEVLLRLRYKDGTEQRQKYMKDIIKLAREIDDTTRKEDPYRYTMIPFYGVPEPNLNSGLTKIPMIVGWNFYNGWYGRNLNDLQKNMEIVHKADPDKPIIITEYGAGADPRLRTNHPELFDFTINYQLIFHKHYLPVFLSTPYIAGANAWNFNDFNSEDRKDAVPHINSKGLVGTNRVPKDTYYYYQACLSEKPVVKIGSRNWTERAGIEDSLKPGFVTQKTEIYSNQKEVGLIVNNKNLGQKKVEDHVAIFDVPFSGGKNYLRAYSGETEDMTVIDMQVFPKNLNKEPLDLRGIRISVGDERYFNDPVQHTVWLPDRKYTSGSFGHIGGEMYKADTKAYGSFENILGTGNDPIFQTQLTGLKAYRIDVPDGQYTLTLDFAELEKNSHPHIEGNNAPKQRIFGITVNGEVVYSGLNIEAEYGALTAVSKKLTVCAKNNEGVEIKFIPIKGEPILNGIELSPIN